MRCPLALVLALTVLVLPACSAPPAPQTSGPADTAGPPLEQIADDFEQAEWVAEVRVLEVVPASNFPADNGSGGNAVCLVRAAVERVHKAPFELTGEVEYRFTAEGRCGPFPAPDERLVVFLRSDPATGELWQLAEGAQLPATPEVVERVRALP